MTRGEYEAAVEGARSTSRRRRLPGRASHRWTGRARSSRSRSTAACGSSIPRPTCLPRVRGLAIAGASPEPLREGERRPRRGAPDRRHAAARGRRPRRTSGWRRSCSPTPRSAPSTDAGRSRAQRRRRRCGSARRGERADDDRDLLARDAHRLVGHGTAAPRARRWTRCAPASRRALCRARRRSARWRSSASSSPASAASTAARSATSATRATSTLHHIRTVVVKDGIAHIQAGAGIVADSDPGYEYDETIAKARAMFKAVELARRSRTGPEPRCACS